MPNNFQNVLPNPLYDITDAGFSGSGGDIGPGYAAITIAELKETLSETSISGKLLSRSNNYPKWMINLRYNPLTEEEFKVVYNFLLQKHGSKRPFYVQLPQYAKSRNSSFMASISSSGNPVTNGAGTAGSHSILITGISGWASSWGNIPWFGDLFTFKSSNSLHKKAYQVAFVETPAINTEAVPSGSVRVHFSPGLQRNVESGAELIFDKPLIKVVQTSDIIEFKLDAEGLYNLPVSLKEAFY